MMTTDYPHIEFRDESPFITGSRVPVRRLWSWHRKGLPIATLIKRYPELGPSKVLVALAFAYDNQELIERDIARAELPPPDSRQKPLPF